MRRSLALVALVIVGGCGTPLLPTPVGVPENPGAEMRPDLIVAEPVQVEPGGIAALTFPEETTRGILFTLDRETVEGWRTLYFLTSDGPGPEWERTWTRAGGAGLAVEDIGVGGPRTRPGAHPRHRGAGELSDLHRQRGRGHVRANRGRGALVRQLVAPIGVVRLLARQRRVEHADEAQRLQHLDRVTVVAGRIRVARTDSMGLAPCRAR